MNGIVRRLLCLLLLAASAIFALPAQARAFSQAELDALLAPIALYPDSVLGHILVAATYPDDVREAARWLERNPHLEGEAAVRAAEPLPWHPSQKVLLAFPELVERMAESPQWTADLGAAYLAQQPYVMQTVQALRRRAQATGMLRSDEYQEVLHAGSSVVVRPVQSHIVVVRHFDPHVVYGPWWWHSHRPMSWRPWVHHHRFHHHQHDHHHRRPHHAPVKQFRFQPHHRPLHDAPRTLHNHVHQAQNARPIVQGAHIRPPIETPRHGRGEPRQPREAHARPHRHHHHR